MPTGHGKRRGDVHADGDRHAGLHVWVVTTAPGAAEVVLQRRSATKDSWPGKLDVAVGGHVRAGETLAETIRESEEEIGLPLDETTLVRLGRRFTGRVAGGGVVDDEVQDVFAAVVDTPLTGLVLHPDEVDAVVRLPFDRARALLVSGERVSAVERRREESDERLVELDRSDVVPIRDGYYATALAALERLAAGVAVEPFTIRS